MSAPTDSPSTDGRPAPKELTVMILFAGDNELSALLVSQVKAIKDAGFHEQVDVVLHIDPSERGVPARLLHVNRQRRAARRARGGPAPSTSIGPGSSFVRNMGEDALSADDLEKKPGKFAREIAKSLRPRYKLEARDPKAPKANDAEPTATETLKTFLGYCRENHPAKNYMLILFGHGLVVAKDTFLIDQNPVSGITLPDLKKLLKGFSDEVQKEDADAKLHLIGMHSCAMSAVEVAYELRDVAGYMIGAEGIAYVGSWPYQNLLVKIFRALEAAPPERPLPPDFYPTLVERLYDHTLHNGTDFVYMGISLDLTLCSLDSGRYEKLTGEIRELVVALKAALKTGRGKEMILLAHWEAQSYWDENYTDLYDFCFCLERGCRSLLDTLGPCAELFEKAGGEAGSAEATEALRQLAGDVAALDSLAAACGKVQKRLGPTGKVVAKDGDGPIVRSENIGSEYQYSHGLSVYFPWSEPLDDEPPPTPPVAIQSQRLTQPTTASGAINIYRGYAFTQEFGKDSWLSFLEAYFEATRRKPRWEEEGVSAENFESKILNFPPNVAVAHAVGSLEKATGGTEKATGGSGSTCTCPSIKNYPIDEKRLPGRKVRQFFATDGLLERGGGEAGAGDE